MPLKKNEWKWWQGMLVGGIILLSAMIVLMMMVKPGKD
jgi:hypothetical protein